MHNRVPVTFSKSAEHVRNFTETYQQFRTEFSSEDKKEIFRAFLLALYHYTLNVYPSD